MDWIDEMKEAMKILKTACGKNEIWGACGGCPFDDYCTVLENEGMGIPSEWEID